MIGSSPTLQQPGGAPLCELRRQVVEVLRPYADRISVYGSVARGEAHAESDVDLLVRLRPEGERAPLGLRWFALEAELAERIGRAVDLVTEDGLSPHLRAVIKPDLITLYEE